MHYIYECSLPIMSHTALGGFLRPFEGFLMALHNQKSSSVQIQFCTTRTNFGMINKLILSRTIMASLTTLPLPSNLTKASLTMARWTVMTPPCFTHKEITQNSNCTQLLEGMFY